MNTVLKCPTCKGQNMIIDESTRYSYATCANCRETVKKYKINK